MNAHDEAVCKTIRNVAHYDKAFMGLLKGASNDLIHMAGRTFQEKMLQHAGFPGNFPVHRCPELQRV